MEPFLYQSIGGGIVFFVGMIFAWRQGYLGWSGRGLWHLLVCLGVYFLFLGMTAFLQFAPMEEAPAQAYMGGAEHVLGSEGKTRQSIALSGGGSSVCVDAVRDHLVSFELRVD